MNTAKEVSYRADGVERRPQLVAALDFPDAPAALDMARRLKGAVPWMKIGLELFTAAGPEVVRAVKDMEFNVFLDLKFLDIPNTVAGAVRSAVACGADMLNVHVLGGADMLRAAVAGRDEAAEACRRAARPALLGVTVLTSLSAGDAPFLRARTPSEVVLELARDARDAGLDGVVASAREAADIKAACGAAFLCLTPGIRIPAPESAPDDQRRVTTPEAAVAAGSDFLVVGRPITRAPDPVAVAREFLDRMGAAPAGAGFPAGGR